MTTDEINARIKELKKQGVKKASLVSDDNIKNVDVKMLRIDRSPYVGPYNNNPDVLFYGVGTYQYASPSSIKYINAGESVYFYSRCTVGSDPEFFFVRDGKVIPSTEVISEETENVKRDGFQGELNPKSNSCREVAGANIARAVTKAQTIARRVGASVSFGMSTVIDDDVWKRTGASLKRFGCNPTVNVHEDKFVRSTGMREKFRSCGGHVHLGLNTKARKKVNQLIQVMDIVVGNTCVLIDRDPANARRRKIYGRAGEHRIKPYGVEYRVPSNFWLKHYKLWSMVSGLARNSVCIVENDLEDKLFALFDMKKVRDAINNNDYDLAMENFLIYKKFLVDNDIYTDAGIDKNRVDKFLKWAQAKNPYARLKIATDEAILTHHKNRSSHWQAGFESFIKSVK